MALRTHSSPAGPLAADEAQAARKTLAIRPEKLMALVTEESVLKRMRTICARLPGTEEVATYGHPGFKAGGRLYAVLEEYKKELSICVKIGVEVLDLFLRDNRYYKAPYIGNQGWISLKVHAAPLDWEEIEELLVGSYQIITSDRKRKRRTNTTRAARR